MTTASDQEHKVWSRIRHIQVKRTIYLHMGTGTRRGKDKCTKIRYRRSQKHCLLWQSLPIWLSDTYSAFCPSKKSSSSCTAFRKFFSTTTVASKLAWILTNRFLAFVLLTHRSSTAADSLGISGTPTAPGSSSLRLEGHTAAAATATFSPVPTGKRLLVGDVYLHGTFQPTYVSSQSPFFPC